MLCTEYSSRFWKCCQPYQKNMFLLLSSKQALASTRSFFFQLCLQAGPKKTKVNRHHTGSFRISNFCFHVKHQLLKTARLTNITQGQTNQQKTFKYDTSSKEAKNQVAATNSLQLINYITLQKNWMFRLLIIIKALINSQISAYRISSPSFSFKYNYY